LEQVYQEMKNKKQRTMTKKQININAQYKNNKQKIRISPSGGQV